MGGVTAHGNNVAGSSQSQNSWYMNTYLYSDHYSRTYPNYTSANYDNTITGNTSGHTWKYDFSLVTTERSW